MGFLLVGVSNCLPIKPPVEPTEPQTPLGWATQWHDNIQVLGERVGTQLKAAHGAGLIDDDDAAVIRAVYTEWAGLMNRWLTLLRAAKAAGGELPADHPLLVQQINETLGRLQRLLLERVAD